MNETAVFDWLTSTTPGQFVAIVLVLVFGSRQILSEKTLKSSLGGLLIVPRWLGGKREEAAQAEAQEIIELRETELKQHQYIVYVTRQLRDLELITAHEGWELPHILTYQEWLDTQPEQ